MQAGLYTRQQLGSCRFLASSPGAVPSPAPTAPRLLPDCQLWLSKHHHLIGAGGEEEGIKTSLCAPTLSPKPHFTAFRFPTTREKLRRSPLEAAYAWLGSQINFQSH